MTAGATRPGPPFGAPAAPDGLRRRRGCAAARRRLRDHPPCPANGISHPDEARRGEGGLTPALRAVALLAALLLSAPAAAQLRGGLDADGPAPGPSVPASEAGYRVRPVDGAPVGPGVRRTIETFGAWTLICDEARRQRICNASQSVVAADGRLAFSWSLAATKGGEPVFLLRAPVSGFPAHTVGLDFGGGETPIRLGRCDERLCVGFLPLDGDIVRAIRAGGGAGIRYRTGEGAVPVSIRVSLDGLARAIGSIR